MWGRKIGLWGSASFPDSSRKRGGVLQMAHPSSHYRHWAGCLVEGDHEHHVAAHPKIAGATYWWKADGYYMINACGRALCVWFPSGPVGRASSAVGFGTGYWWQTLLMFLVHLRCDSHGSEVGCGGGLGV